MRIAHQTFEVQTRGRGLYPLAEEAKRFLAAQDVQEGLVTVYLRHTSASLLIQENADPEVLSDMDERGRGEALAQQRRCVEGAFHQHECGRLARPA